MDCSLPGSSIHGIFQARVLEWGAIAISTVVHLIIQGSIIKKKMMYTFTDFDVDIYKFSPIMLLCITAVAFFPRIP